MHFFEISSRLTFFLYTQKLLAVVQAQVGGFRVKLGGGSGSSVAQPNAPLILFISRNGALGQCAAFKSRNSI